MAGREVKSPISASLNVAVPGVQEVYIPSECTSQGSHWMVLGGPLDCEQRSINCICSRNGQFGAQCQTSSEVVYHTILTRRYSTMDPTSLNIRDIETIFTSHGSAAV